MTPAERQQKIDSYGAGFQALQDALKEFPVTMWQYKPAPSEWSIHEQIIHLADSETNSFGRFRRAIAEPGSDVFAYDQDVWAVAMDYHARSTETALNVLCWIRQSNHELLSATPAASFANTIQHPENGLMTVDDILTVYEAHIPGHIQQMRGVYSTWLKSLAS